MIRRATRAQVQRVRGTIFEKLTNHERYTGTHRHRFDEEGRGMGIEGRDRVAKGHGTFPGESTLSNKYVLHTYNPHILKTDPTTTHS